MSCILNFILRRPVLSVLVLGLFVSFAGYNGSFVIRDASVDGLIIKGEEKDYYDSVQDIFGDDTMVSILIKADSGVFQEPILEAVKNISDGVAGIEIEEGTASIPVVSHVSSLSTVNKILNKDGFLDTDKLMDYLPDGEEEIEVIKVDAIRNELLYNDLLSRDLKTAAVNVFLPSAPVGSANYNQNVTRAIENVIQKERERLLGLDLEVDIFQIGMPNVKVGLADLIARDMQVLIPLAVAVILCVLWIAFRTPIAVILPLVTGISSVLGCLAFMAFMGYTINLVSNIVPLLLLVIGSTEDIHMLADYKYQVRHAKGKLEAIRNMLLKCSLAIFLTSLTTALGFLTLKVNPIQMLKEFGISAAVGLGLNYILTIIAVPTLLKFMPVPKHFRESQKKSPLVQKLSANLYSLAVNHRVAIGLMTAFISVLSIAGCLKIKVDADLVSFFKEDNPIRIKLQQLEQNLSG
jgi:predicted RND superfamily exporter protein